VLVVDYSNADSIKHALTGVDTVISTVTGDPQIALIHAAYQARVRRFAPAEFEGAPASQPNPDPLDARGSKILARSWLEHYRNTIESTTFVCGVLYERFAPGGLRQFGLGMNTGVSGEGDYLMDIRGMTVNAPVWDVNNREVKICLAAAQDVARFVVKALSLRRWPRELRTYTEKMSVMQLVTMVQEVRGKTHMLSIICSTST